MGAQHSSLSQGHLDHSSESRDIYMSAAMQSARPPAASEAGDATKDGGLRQVLDSSAHACQHVWLVQMLNGPRLVALTVAVGASVQVSADSVAAYNTSGTSSTDAGPSASAGSLQSSTGAHPDALFARMRNMSLDERRMSHGMSLPHATS